MYWIYLKNPVKRIKDWVMGGCVPSMGSRFYRMIGAETRALNLLESVLARLPRRADLHLEAGKLYLHRGQLDRAAWHLSRANCGVDASAFIGWLEETALNDHNETLGDRAKVFSALGHWYLQAGEPEKALMMYDRAMLSGRSSGKAVLNDRGLALMQLGRMREAKAHFEQARTYGSNPELEFNTGLLHSKLGNHSEAVEHYERAQRYGLNSIDLLNNKGFSLFYLKRYEEAILCYELARKLAPGDPTVLANLAGCYEKGTQFDKAITAYHTAIRHSPNDPSLHGALATCLVQAGRYDDAVHAYDRAVALAPHNALYQASRALALGKMGRGDQALQAFQALLTRDPRSRTIWGLYADFLAQSGEMEQAAEAYNFAWGLSDFGAA